MNKSNSGVAQLCAEWLDAKQAETRAAFRRVDIEREICERLEAKDEGAITHKRDGYKITLTQPVTRKIDAEAWARVKHHCPDKMQPVKWKLEADAVGCKYLAANEPEIWAKIASAFEAKPGKIGVKIEEEER